MEHLFIINPAAGHHDRTREYTAKIEAVCEARGIPYRIAVSEGPGDCTRLARSAALSGKTVRLYACGGDGTLNEVVQGAAGAPNVSVTCFCGGSGNDFVKIFGGKEPFMDLERLLDCETAEFDLIDCNGHLCLNNCCVGLDARIGVEVPRYKRLPLVSGPMAYILSTLVNLFRGTHRHYVVESGGRVYDEELTLICVANGQWYGGSFHAVPDAVPDDGVLEALLVKRLPLWKLASVIGTYQRGGYKTLPQFLYHLRTDGLTIRCDSPTTAALDGEALEASEFHIQISDKKLRFFYPKGLSYQTATPKNDRAGVKP